MPPESADNLHWTAFLYVSGDLSDLEEAAFELRLADDQAAREAVLEAVDFVNALTSAGPEAWVPRRTSRKVLTWSTLTAAACLAIASLWALKSSRIDPPDAVEVAMAWSGLRNLEPIGGPEVDLVAVADLETSNDPTLPSWLLSATEEARDPSSPEEN